MITSGWLVWRNLSQALVYSPALATSMRSAKPLTPTKSGDNLPPSIGTYWSCLRELVQAHTTVELSLGGGIQIRTEFGEAATSRYCASSSFMVPATCFIPALRPLNPHGSRTDPRRWRDLPDRRARWQGKSVRP